MIDPVSPKQPSQHVASAAKMKKSFSEPSLKRAIEALDNPSSSHEPVSITIETSIQPPLADRTFFDIFTTEQISVKTHEIYWIPVGQDSIAHSNDELWLNPVDGITYKPYEKMALEEWFRVKDDWIEPLLREQIPHATTVYKTTRDPETWQTPIPVQIGIDIPPIREPQARARRNHCRAIVNYFVLATILAVNLAVLNVATIAIVCCTCLYLLLAIYDYFYHVRNNN